MSSSLDKWVQAKEQQKREADRQKQERMQMIKQEQMKEVTGHPVISQRARQLGQNRDYQARMSWKQVKEEKLYILKTEKASLEREEQQRHLDKQGKYLTKESAKYLSHKENYNSQIPSLVEERLLTYG